MTSEQLVFPSEGTQTWELEKHLLSESDGLLKFENGCNVLINLNLADCNLPRDRDSSRIHTSVLSEYKWASEEFYNGRILAVHDNLIAYRVFNESTGEAVRVLERNTSRRHLIKSFKNPTADLQWATHAPLLAVLDTNANLYVYHVDNECVVTKYLNIIRPCGSIDAEFIPRLSWCSYIPESEDLDETLHMLSVFYGSTVEAIAISVIKSKFLCEEVTLNECMETSEAYIKLPVDDSDSTVQAVCLSPDATAIAVANSSGIVTFFIIDADGARFAHNWQPDPARQIQDLVFLDNTTGSVESAEQFWKYAISTTDEGRRIQLHNTENWSCIARLVFERSDQLTKLALTVDPSAKFFFLTDYDAANIYCIEIAYLTGIPRFAACTKISFCHPLVNVMPIAVSPATDANIDFSLSDDDIQPTDVVASFVALSQRSLLYLEVDLETTGSADLCKGGENSKTLTPTLPSTAFDSAANGNGEDTKNSKNLHNIQRYLESMNMKMDQQNEEFAKRLLEERELTLVLIQQLREDAITRDERSLLRFESLISENRTAIIEAMQTSLEMKMDSVAEKLKTATSESLRSSLNQTMQKVDTKLLNDESAKAVRAAMMAVVVPALENVCNTLFQQLNETFRSGLNEYLKQMRILCAETLRSAGLSDENVAGLRTGVINTAELIQLIERKQYASAFAKALSKDDLAGLMLVCNGIDPEVVADADIPQTILLNILKTLANNLENETDLKFRYIENSLTALRVKDPTIAGSYRQVLNNLLTSLSVFTTCESNSSFKRRARIMSQLAASILK